MQFGRLRRANPPQTRPIECRTLPQSAAQNTFRILLFPLLSLLFVEQICDLLSLPTVVVHGPSLAGNPAAIRHCPASAIPHFRTPCCIGPKQEDHFMGFQWQIPPSMRFQISEITEIRRFNCNCRPPPIRFPPFSRAVRDKIDLPRSTRPLILPIPFPHSLRRAIFGRIMEE